MNRSELVADQIAETGVVLAIDKPLDWTSYAVVRKVRSLVNVRRVGHAGTLDPRATGLLIVCVGKKTREVSQYMEFEKEYEGVLELGIRTPSFDTETEVCERRPWDGVTPGSLRERAAAFVGTLDQQPPMYSAVKQGGIPLYRHARRGMEVPREHRKVRVYAFDILSTDLPRARFRVVCSKGTYVRSLVDELGTQLGCGATLMELRRTRIGAVCVDDAWTMESLADVCRRQGLARQTVS